MKIKNILTILILFIGVTILSPQTIHAKTICGKPGSNTKVTTQEFTDPSGQEFVHIIISDQAKLGGRTLDITIECDSKPVRNVSRFPTDSNGNITLKISKNELVGSCTLTAKSPQQSYKIDCQYPIQTIHTTGQPQINNNEVRLPLRIIGPFTNPNTSLTGYFISFECDPINIPHTWFYADFVRFDNGTGIFRIRDYQDMKSEEFPLKVKVQTCRNFTLLSPDSKKVSSIQQALKTTNPLANTPCRFLDPNTSEYQNCINCMGNAKSPTGKVWTVFGCVDTTSTGGLFSTVFQFLSYMLGGVAMLLLIYASFLYITSQGDAEKIKTAKSLLTAIIAGMLFIIFSIMIMKFVGITLLDLPTLNQ